MNRAWPFLAALLLTPVAACSDETKADNYDPMAPIEGTITVSAAASLTDAFTDIAADFEAANPGTTVDLSFGPSNALAAQVREGAPVDVIATADMDLLETLAEDELLAGTPRAFATNGLAIVTRPGNPDAVSGLADLADVADDGVVALCGADVPCGRAAAQALAAAAVEIPEGSVTRGQDARATLAAVAEGDALAAIVYATDARDAGSRVAAVPVPAEHDVRTTYGIAVGVDAEPSATAASFLGHVLAAAGQRVLRERGFGLP